MDWPRAAGLRFPNPELEKQYWTHYTRMVLVNTDRSFYTGSSLIITAILLLLVRQSFREQISWYVFAGPFLVLVRVFLLLLAIEHHRDWYLRWRGINTVVSRLLCTTACTLIGTYYFPARSDTWCGVIFTKLVCRGPLLPLLFNGIGLQLRFDIDLVIQSLSLAITLPFTTDLCAFGFPTDGQKSLFRWVESGIESFGTAIVGAVDPFGAVSVEDAALDPADDACVVVTTFALIWVGWLVPVATTYGMEWYNRAVFKREHLSEEEAGDWSVAEEGRGLLTAAVWGVNSLFTMELSWRVLKLIGGPL